MKAKRIGIICAAVLTGFLALALMYSCRRDPLVVELLYSFPAESKEGVIDADYAELDGEVYREGSKSLRITAEKPVIIKLYEINEPGIHDMTLIYKAWVKTGNLKGNVFLEMRVGFEKTKQLVRGLSSKISEDTGFKEIDTIFFLKKNHYPESIELNLVIEGQGTVWIDSVRLYKGPLTFLRAKEF
jgi:hypothetical protein